MRLAGLSVLLFIVGCSGGEKDTVDDTTETPDTDSTDTDTTDTIDTPGDPNVDADSDGSSAADDCNDADPNVHPGAVELCDNRDSDCDPANEEGLATFVPYSGGASVDLTAAFAGAGGSIGGDGEIRLCGGTWSGVVTTDPGSVIYVVADANFGTPVFNGGGLSFSGPGEATGITFQNATVRAMGGDIALRQSTLIDCTVYVYEGSTVTGDRLTVSAPNAGYFVRAMSGAVNTTRTVTLTDSTFTNVAGLVQGDIYLVLLRSQLYGASNAGYATNALIEDVTMEDGGISISGHGVENTTVRRATVSSTTGSSSFSNLGSLTLEDVTVTHRNAGFALTVQNTGFVSAGGLTFTDASTSSAGLLRLDGTGRAEMNVTLTDSAFDGNGRGTLVSVAGPTALTVRDATFAEAGNTAINAQSSHNLVVEDSTFIANNAGPADGGVQFYAGGGAMWMQTPGYTTTVRRSTFTDNHGDTYAGGILLNQGSLVVEGSTFTMNSANWGGAVYIWEGATTTLSDNVFEANTAVYAGGAVVGGGSGTMAVSGGRFYRNSLTGNGGAVYVGTPTTFTGVDLGTGADDNSPDDIAFASGAASLDVGMFTAACDASGCP
jgi:hypothetical protein